MSITTYVWKVASRCNLDCSYCYVYHGADASWRTQPGYMGTAVATMAAQRIRAHCEKHAIRSVNLNFHGGEPLLAGVSGLEAILQAIRTTFRGSDIEVNSSLQSNALLLDRAACAWLAANRIGLYLSLDGPPVLNDRQRVDRRRQPTGTRVEERIEELIASDYSEIFQGFLVVVDPSFSASAVFDYLAKYKPLAIEFLLPLVNHDTRVEGDYAGWLTDCFDHWFDGNSGIRSRTFERFIARLLLPGEAGESDPIDAMVIETNGAYELDDTLKTAFSGAAKLGFNVFDHTLEEVTESRIFRTRRDQFRPAGLCQSCRYLAACRGGHISQRYSKRRGFDNPNVYCDDLKALISHISNRVRQQLAESRRSKDRTGAHAHA